MLLNRRSLLKGAGALMLPWPAVAAAPRPAPLRFTVPTIDRLELTVLVDGTAALFGLPIDKPDLKTIPTPRLADYHAAFLAQWGYSILASTRAGAVERRTLVDFGYTPEALLNNMRLLGIDPATIDAMVLSHGHYDHFGGLDGLLATGKVRRGTPLFVGGEEAFCDRIRGMTPDGPPFGAIDRPALAKAGIKLVVGPEPAIAGQGFTTGMIPLVSPEHPVVPTAMLPGKGCDRAAIDPAKRDKDFVVDDAVHELGTAFNVAGHGLVVIGSCSHRGIINTVRRAQAVSGIDKVHAIVGGFHLVPPQTPAQALQTLDLMRAMNPDYIIPGHCSGETFIAAALAAMPDRVVRSVVGQRYQFGVRD
ncbi:MBL fold metallo-hydrolase [Sphingomonas sp. So64.6b]|uniref:MBL fold metallo-hydrolase n=1 Tax=Sphingomonas sp. So64.6b TaxID=2997354 RepID=UPI0016030C98|nr:MBL fold metallo-hydrolase [Sphingomonas sp. So64.6b]QNA85265.1 MBL fold metallo-hydrolase [Sphingomonas sp. So64.6b]